MVAASSAKLVGASPNTPLEFCQELVRDQREATASQNASNLAELEASLRLEPKRVPCGLLYDDIGSQLYDDITKLPEYYPFSTEKQMLADHAEDIITHIPKGSVVVELGCGTAEKTATLLQALIARDGADQVHFLGIDVSMEALYLAQDNLLEHCPQLEHNVELVCAEYLQGMKEARLRHPNSMLCILWLGSSVGNLQPDEAVQFFNAAQVAAGHKTQVFLCADLWKDARMLHAAYCDSQGVTEAFIKNGMSHALAALGCHEGRSPDAWKYDVVVNPKTRQVEMWLEARHTVPSVVEGVDICRGERVLMEVSRKFTVQDIRELAFKSGFFIQAAWRNPKYSMQILATATQALQHSWASADALFARIPSWDSQPIDARRPFCFYYGHMASFAKLKMLPAEKESELDHILSRGIDPSMLDPTQCHSHPKAPQQWPSKPELCKYVQQVRALLLERCQDGMITTRSISLVLEHDAMHLETLCYMLAQEQRLRFEGGTAGTHASDGQRQNGNGAANGHSNGNGVANGHSNGNGVANGHSNGSGAHVRHAAGNGRSNGYSLANGAAMASGAANAAAELVAVPGGSVTLGIDVAPESHFVWDNEGPRQPPQQVAGFKVSGRPVSNGEFHRFVVGARGYQQPELWAPADLQLLKRDGRSCPATWTVHDDGSAYVHGVDSTQVLEEVADQPVFVSLIEAQAYCKWVGGRIMTEPEYELALAHSQTNDSLQELTSGGWEWTSTPFLPFEGFAPMPEYKEYSTDFFDANHFVLKGSSHVTLPSMVRQSFRNFYQAQYPFLFAKFRISH